MAEASVVKAKNWVDITRETAALPMIAALAPPPPTAPPTAPPATAPAPLATTLVPTAVATLTATVVERASAPVVCDSVRLIVRENHVTSKAIEGNKEDLVTGGPTTTVANVTLKSEDIDPDEYSDEARTEKAEEAAAAAAAVMLGGRFKNACTVMVEVLEV